MNTKSDETSGSERPLQEYRCLVAALAGPEWSSENNDVLRFAGLPNTEVVPLLVAALTEPNDTINENAADVLKQIGPLSVPDLIAALNAPDERTRWWASWILGEIGTAAEAAVPELIVTVLADADEATRNHAAKALGKIGVPEGIISLAMLATKADNGSVSDAAASALIEIGTAAVPALIDAISDTDAGVREKATRIVGEIWPPAEAAVPVLIAALADTDDDVRANAAEALRQVGLPAVPALIDTLANADDDVRSYAAWALGRSVRRRSPPS